MQDLEKIAAEYHLASSPDMFIEAICQRKELEWLLPLIPAGSRILELGYGDGVTSEILSRRYPLTVVEGSSLIADKAKLSHDSIEVVTSLFENFSPVRKFDCIFASHVFEHVDDPETLAQLCLNWLTDEGILIVIVPNRHSVHRQIAVLAGIQDKLESLSKRDHLVGHQRVYSVELLSELLENSGFQIIKKRGFFLKPFANSQMLDISPKVIEALCDFSETLPPELGASLAFVCRKISAIKI